MTAARSNGAGRRRVWQLATFSLNLFPMHLPATPARRLRSVVFLLSAGLLVTLAGCKKDDPQPRTTNALKLEFQHNAPGDTLPLRLNTAYTTAAGQLYRITRLWYYVSNVRLLRADGTAWTEPNSYHLLKVAGAPANNPTITLAAVPLGEFTGVEFSIGIDSARNHHGDQTGVLSPSEGMIWTWATGYKFWVQEGDQMADAHTLGDPFLYHIGTDALYRTVRLNFPEAAKVTSAVAPEAHLYVDVNRTFDTLDLTDPAQRDVMAGNPLAPAFADRLTTLFRVAHVHND